MKQFKILFLFLPLLLTACKTTSTHLSQTTREISTGSFDRVVIKGPMDVNVISGIPENDVRLIGRTQDMNRVKTKVEKNTLTITMRSSSAAKPRLLVVIRARNIYDMRYSGSGHVEAIGLNSPWFNADLNATGKVDLSGKHLYLSQLDLHGSGDINLHNVHSKNLMIISKGSDRVTLSGEVDVNKIRMDGTSCVKILWVKSSVLEIRGKGKSYLELAGNIGTLDVILRDQAYFNGRYLRTHFAYVKTYDSSRADLQVTKVQNTLASQSSNIYYYKTPKYVGTHMDDSGAVLDLDGMR